MVKNSDNNTIDIKQEVAYVHLPYMHLTLPNFKGQGHVHLDSKYIGNG